MQEEGALGASPGLEQGREVAALAQLRDLQLDGAGTHVPAPRPVREAVAGGAGVTAKGQRLARADLLEQVEERRRRRGAACVTAAERQPTVLRARGGALKCGRIALEADRGAQLQRDRVAQAAQGARTVLALRAT